MIPHCAAILQPIYKQPYHLQSILNKCLNGWLVAVLQRQH